MTTMTRVVMTGAAMAAGFLRAGDWWVDSLGSGDGTSPGTPMSSVQGAIDAAGVGDTIHIHGGEGRVYTNTLYTVNKPLTLQDWTAKPIFRVTNAVDSIASRVVNIAAADVALRNLRFEIAGAAIGENDNIVEITTNAFNGGAAHNVTIDGCEFRMPAFGGAWNQGAPVRKATAPHGTNAVVRNCLFRDWDYGSGDGYRLLMISLDGEHHQVVGNVFTNTSKILGGTMRHYRFSANRIFNCRNNQRPYDIPADYGGMLQSGYNSLRDGEISHNIVWNNNGRRTSFLNKVREGFNGDTRIFNNTVYGADSLVGAIYYNDGTRWNPKIYNNLLINNAYTNIYGIGASSPFLSATEIKNNLWHGGANELADPPSVGITPVDCYNVSCAFVNTTDAGSPDFLRPDGNQTPQAMQGIGGDYPTYIGAVEPKFGNPATLILLR
jgi:hypothetical protein